MKPIIIISLITFSFNAAAEWVEYSSMANGDVYFYDNTRLQRQGSEIDIWNRARYRTSVMGASSYQSLLKINCSDKTETILQSTFYSDKDWTTPAMATNNKPKPEKMIKSNSATEQLAIKLCRN